MALRFLTKPAHQTGSVALRFLTKPAHQTGSVALRFLTKPAHQTGSVALRFLTKPAHQTGSVALRFLTKPLHQTALTKPAHTTATPNRLSGTKIPHQTGSLALRFLHQTGLHQAGLTKPLSPNRYTKPLSLSWHTKPLLPNRYTKPLGWRLMLTSTSSSRLRYRYQKETYICCKERVGHISKPSYCVALSFPSSSLIPYPLSLIPYPKYPSNLRSYLSHFPYLSIPPLPFLINQWINGSTHYHLIHPDFQSGQFYSIQFNSIQFNSTHPSPRFDHIHHPLLP